MNDIPGLNLLPQKYQGIALFLLAISPYITRGYHAVSQGGGLRSIFSAIWLGTNGPKQKDETSNEKTP